MSGAASQLETELNQVRGCCDAARQAAAKEVGMFRAELETLQAEHQAEVESLASIIKAADLEELQSRVVALESSFSSIAGRRMQLTAAQVSTERDGMHDDEVIRFQGDAADVRQQVEELKKGNAIQISQVAETLKTVMEEYDPRFTKLDADLADMRAQIHDVRLAWVEEAAELGSRIDAAKVANIMAQEPPDPLMLIGPHTEAYEEAADQENMSQSTPDPPDAVSSPAGTDHPNLGHAPEEIGQELAATRAAFANAMKVTGEAMKRSEQLAKELLLERDPLSGSEKAEETGATLDGLPCSYSSAALLPSSSTGLIRGSVSAKMSPTGSAPTEASETDTCLSFALAKDRSRSQLLEKPVTVHGRVVSPPRGRATSPPRVPRIDLAAAHTAWPLLSDVPAHSRSPLRSAVSSRSAQASTRHLVVRHESATQRSGSPLASSPIQGSRIVRSCSMPFSVTLVGSSSARQLGSHQRHPSDLSNLGTLSCSPLTSVVGKRSTSPISSPTLPAASGPVADGAYSAFHRSTSPSRADIRRQWSSSSVGLIRRQLLSFTGPRRVCRGEVAEAKESEASL
eukprot:gnl/TRDRNA2_/TRDRNA2_146946_c1_seq2.p1 gnl/TRDRNA2_/TRDRNA2_146946_c1~~gnl/TRDRNA2_/TRDRNA2_146946_c1_seq2.p1  ORF type:complete len:633 (+),score=103.98 gnl/TRDRNA2_/TRDRNA2_146946_c1_seq2:191-1900(+)